MQDETSTISLAWIVRKMRNAVKAEQAKDAAKGTAAAQTPGKAAALPAAHYGSPCQPPEGAGAAAAPTPMRVAAAENAQMGVGA